MDSLSPFQWVFSLVDNVSDPAQAMADSLDRIATVSETVVSALGGVSSLVIGGLGLIGLTATIDGVVDALQETEDKVVGLANKVGSIDKARDLRSWAKGVARELPVVKDDLIEIAGVYGRMGRDATELNTRGLAAAALGTDDSIVGIEATLRSLSRQSRLTHDDYLSLNEQFGVTREEYGQMMEAMEGTTRHSVGRINAFLGVLENKFGDTIDRTTDTISHYQSVISGIMSSIRSDFLGDPDTGLLRVVKDILKDFIDFYDRNEARIESFLQFVNQIVTVVFKSLSKALNSIMETVDYFFDSTNQTMDSFVKNTVLPLVTFFEIVQAKLYILLRGFVKGFLDSPVWGMFADAMTMIIDGIMGVVRWMGILDNDSGQLDERLYSLGHVAGVFFSILVGGRLVMIAYSTTVGILSAAKAGLLAVTALLKGGLSILYGVMTFGIGVIKAVGVALQFLAANPVGLIITAVGLLVLAIWYLWNNWDTVSVKLKKAWSVFSSHVIGELQDIWGYVEDWFSLIKAIFTGDLQGIIDASVRLFERWKRRIMRVISPVIDLFKKGWEMVSNFFSAGEDANPYALQPDQGKGAPSPFPPPSEGPQGVSDTGTPPRPRTILNNKTTSPEDIMSPGAGRNLGVGRDAVTNLGSRQEREQEASGRDRRISTSDGDVHLHISGYIRDERDLAKLMAPLLRELDGKRSRR